MNEKWDERETDQQFDRQSDRSLGSSSHFGHLTLDKQLGSGEPQFLHHSLERDYLLQEALVSAVKSSAAWTRPTYTELSPLPQSPLRVSERMPGNLLVFHWTPGCWSAMLCYTMRSPWQQSQFRSFALQECLQQVCFRCCLQQQGDALFPVYCTLSL